MENRLKRVIVPLFKGDEKSFPFWKKRMEQHFKFEGLLHTLEKTPEEEDFFQPVAGASAAAETERKDKLQARLKEEDAAVNELLLAIDDEPMGHIMHCAYAKDIMDRLGEIFMKRGPMAMLGLRTKLLSLKSRKFTCLKQLFATHQEIIRDLESMGEVIASTEKLTSLLVAIPDEFQHLIGALSVLRKDDLDTMSLEQVQRVFLDAEEGKTKRNMPGPSQVAMTAPQQNYRNLKCFQCGRYGHKMRNCREARRRKEASKPTFHTHPGGKKRDVALVTRQNGAFMVRIPLDELNPDLRRDCRVFQMDFKRLPVPSPTFGGVTLLDSGASNHMFRDAQMFNEMWDYVANIETAKEGEMMRTRRAGNVNLRTNKNFNVHLYNALFVPNLNFNIVSVSRIESTGKAVLFRNGGVEILDNDGTVILTGKRVNGLYILDIEFVGYANKVFASKMLSDAELWHVRYGHLGAQNLNKLVRDNMVERLDVELSAMSDCPFACKSCIYGRQTREVFDNSITSRSNRPLELIHSDVCGQLPEETYDGCRYFVSFIDDYTHFTVVYLIRYKSEVLDKFREYEAMATAHFNLRIAKLRTDNGGEYFGGEFVRFCRERGIQMTPTAPYTPQQNGVSERMNRTLMEKVRTILHESGCPFMFWGEALYASTYTLNRSPTSALSVPKTPYEMWFGVKPDVSKLKVFGCIAYTHVNMEYRTKLDKKSRRLCMMGYAPNGYRLWDENFDRITVSRDVKFDEHHFYFPKVDDELQENPNFCEVEKRPELEIIEVENDLPLNENSEDDFMSVGEPSENEFQDIPEQEGRPQRTIRPPAWLRDYETVALSLNGSGDIPQNIDELRKRTDWDQWKQAIDEELCALKENNTWTLVDELPEGHKAINSMWIFNIKDGETVRYKARLVAKGCSQRPGIDFSDTFAPVAKMTTIRTMLSIAVKKNWIIHQMDVKTAFLNGNLNEEVYMKLPRDENGIVKICKLNKSLYGLKQAGRNWNQRFNEVVTQLGFQRLNSDTCLYKCPEKDLFIILYVDDILLFGSNISGIKWIKEKLSDYFKMKDLGDVKNFLGLEISRNLERGTIELSQQSYVDKILDTFGMKDCRAASTPMDLNCKWVRSEKCTDKPFKELLGCLQYLTLMSRPDITIAVSILSQFQSMPGDEHWVGLKRILRYLHGTKTYRLVYSREKDDEPLKGYADADFANDIEERKSNSGNVFLVYGNIVSWKSKRQQIVTLSSTEAELVSLCEAGKEGVWISNLLQEVGISSIPFTIYEDNIPCIRISEEPREHQRTKHIDVRYMYVRNLIHEKKIVLEYIRSEDQIADMFTKPLMKSRFNKMCELIKMIN